MASKQGGFTPAVQTSSSGTRETARRSCCYMATRSHTRLGTRSRAALQSGFALWRRTSAATATASVQPTVAPTNVGRLYGDVLTIWREAGSTVSGGAVESGHYPAEEAPDVVLEAFERFFV